MELRDFKQDMDVAMSQKQRELHGDVTQFLESQVKPSFEAKLKKEVTTFSDKMDETNGTLKREFGLALSGYVSKTDLRQEAEAQRKSIAGLQEDMGKLADVTAEFRDDNNCFVTEHRFKSVLLKKLMGSEGQQIRRELSGGQK
jgi:hypothetical protein